MVFIVGHGGRLVAVEDTKTVIADGVSNVVTEFAEFGSDRDDAWIEARAHSSVLVIHPIPVIGRPCCSIANKDVVRVSDPEAAWALISVEQAE